ncbi:Protein of unknown function (DUF726) [Teratosphaeria destructans]|uniref:DUF726-domain-containing protein n=1 Tax=Teratosphaeria destructans TaxID=418781 RepID=A0A9W7SL55_9PEZI|nr:Protein of unknown function (DUF726) [Teratosphaeria destructans]
MFSNVRGALGLNPEGNVQQEEEGQSLVTILNTEEDRSALTILIADITETMRQGIVDTFDAKQTGKPSDLVAHLTGDQALANPDVDPGTVSVAEQDKLKKELAQREKELSGSNMQELREAALKYFDEWRTSVIQRVGEVVNSKDEAKKQVDHAKPQSEITPDRTASPMRYPDPPKFDVGVEDMLKKVYSPVNNALRRLPEEKRALILHSVLLLLLSLEHYHANSRTLLLYLTTSLDLSISFLAQDESKVARGLLAAAENMQADAETKKRADENHSNRKWKVGLATVAGAALIGVTGGLAAPLLAAGVGSVMGGLGLGATAAAGYLGTMAGSTILVGGLFGAYGGRMTGKMMDQYAREVEDFAFVPVRTRHKPRKIEKEYRRLRVAIGVIGQGMESFALRFELEVLMNLGNSMTSMVKSAAWGYAKSEIIKRTVFASLTAGLWPLALLKISRVIDNPWSVANYRAQKAGEVLADALINKAQGERPVTLVGYSLGAKVIYTCLQRLAERKAFGLVESAVLIGSPTPSSAADWRRVRTVVTGRVVNIYSTKDYILAFLYRSSSVQFGVAGLQPVENVKGIENVDVSELVSGHTAYRHLTGIILRKIGFEDIDDLELEKEERELEEEEQKEEEERKANKKAQDEQAPPSEQLEKMKLDDSATAATGSDAEAPDVSDQSVKDLEQEIQKKNEQSYMGWAQEKMMTAGTGASVAYEKAKVQWQLRKQQSAGGKPIGDVAGSAASSLT